MIDSLPTDGPADTDADLQHALSLLQRAIDVDWVQDGDDLAELASHLEQGNDWGVQEVFFEPIDGRLSVRFLDDEVWCEIGPFAQQVREMEKAWRSR